MPPEQVNPQPAGHSHPDHEHDTSGSIPQPDASDPRLVGRWERLEATFQGSATHAALLPDGRVFAYGGSSLDPQAFSNPPPAEILDLASEETYPLAMPGVNGDLWCGGHTFLADGRLLFVGGTSYYPPAPDPFYGGLKEAYLFDSTGDTWTRLPDMHEGRWYPTLLRLADDTVLVISGLQYRDPQEEPRKQNILLVVWNLLTRVRQRLVKRQELYDPASMSFSLLPGERLFPLYPRLHLLPDGDVFYSGVFNTHYFVPGRFPSARWDHHSGEWRELGGRHKKKNREEGISVLLALRPPDYRPQVLIAGGGHHNLARLLETLLHGLGRHHLSSKLRRFVTAHKTVEFIDLCDDQPSWVARADMHLPRIHAVGVLLPDGQVLAVGGVPGHGYGPELDGFPVLAPEMYDPHTDTWTLMANPERARMYHATALLLPDGRVLAMGGNPHARQIERSIEIFSPPYLFQGERPVITACPDELRYGGSFEVELGGSQAVDKVVLMRPEAVTHVTNTDQRLLELTIEGQSDGRLSITGPPSHAHMPTGCCLLFVLTAGGIPSEGKFVRLH
ncbi:MAG TPA: galactose oxidase-like domain-containing protein [Anaerolineales bacterium]|nr:galactose oxidase-like domain-containing protein [Anaerolineales bacterium]